MKLFCWKMFFWHLNMLRRNVALLHHPYFQPRLSLSFVSLPFASQLVYRTSPIRFRFNQDSMVSPLLDFFLQRSSPPLPPSLRSLNMAFRNTSVMEKCHNNLFLGLLLSFLTINPTQMFHTHQNCYEHVSFSACVFLHWC